MRSDHCVPSNFISAWPHGNWGHRSSWSKKGSGLHVPSSPLRHWIYYKKFALYLCFKTSSTQEIGVIPLLWHHMWPPPRNIGLIFSSLETHSLPWETKRMAARRQFEAKLCFLSLPQKQQSKLKNWVVNKSFVVWHKCRRKLQISAQNNKASKSASGK